MLFTEVAAADAWPLAGIMGGGGIDELMAKNILCGRPSLMPRMEAVPVRMPLPKAGGGGTLYDLLERMSGRRGFM